MLAIPYRTNLLSAQEELYQFLRICHQKSIEKNCPQIVSISQEISTVDPLVVLQAIAQLNQIHFYFETPAKKQAIAAIDSVASFQSSGKSRFSKSQDFIQSCLNEIISTGDLNLPFAGPHFFCSFTFFADQLPINAPFPPATVFLPRWQVSRDHDTCVLTANLSIDPQVDLESLSEHLWMQFKTITWSGSKPLDIPAQRPPQPFQPAIADSEHFRLAVSSALESIGTHRFNKIVLASTLDVTAPHPFSLVGSLNNLRQHHPDCYIFSSSNGKGNNFIGASPERLISIHDHQLITDALAGSAPRGKTTAEDTQCASRLLNSEKEQREHQFVIDFITGCLSHLGLMPQRLPIPQLLQLSNIQHLWTPIQAKIPTDVHPLKIVDALHPTPAVAGVPTKVAEEQIRRYEGFDRSLYAAPLGWLDHKGNSEFIVGIRSALITGNRARLYAGAGIVAGSNPDKELAEIQLKLQALIRSLI
ncbi:MAG: isochorismate synthase [Kastovskya adunca ATA6-11-RM4]|jgi:menaquinone-specific isochorismate synthase|nr:isochorismate synthase [Kastovskya adunca ATA6-11-RM4]